MRPVPTPTSILRNVLQGLVGLLDLSTADQVQVTIPRFYLEVWQQQLETLLVLLDDPFLDRAPVLLVVVAVLAFAVGLTLGLVLP